MTKMGGDQEDATVRDGGENIQMKSKKKKMNKMFILYEVNFSYLFSF